MENKFKNAIEQIAKILEVKLSEQSEVELAAPVEDVVQPAAEVETPEVETPAMETEEDNTVVDLQNRVAALEAALQQLLEDMQMSKDNAVKLSAVVNEIAKLPAGETIKRTQTMSTEQPKENSALKLFSGKERQQMGLVFKAIQK